MKKGLEGMEFPLPSLSELTALGQYDSLKSQDGALKLNGVKPILCAWKFNFSWILKRP